MVFDDFNSCFFFLSRIFYRHPHWHKSVDSTITSKNTEDKEKCSGRPFNILKRSLRNGACHGHLWDWLSQKNCMLLKMYFDFYSFSGRKRVERFRSEVIKGRIRRGGTGANLQWGESSRYPLYPVVLEILSNRNRCDEKITISEAVAIIWKPELTKNSVRNILKSTKSLSNRLTYPRTP